jgi:hypothetical protein
MNGNMTAVRLYLELTAHFIDREIARFRCGEQAALVSFSNVAKFTRDASKELMALGGERPDAGPRAAASTQCLRPADDEGVHGQAPEF